MALNSTAHVVGPFDTEARERHVERGPKLSKQQLGMRKAILRARQDPIWWAEEIMQHKALAGEATLDEYVESGGKRQTWELDQFQKDLLDAVCDVWRDGPTVINHDRKTQLSIVSGHGPGKTHTAALIAHYVAFCWPARVVVTAPKFDQVRTRMFAAIQRVSYRAQSWVRNLFELGDTQCYFFRKDGSKNKDHCIIGETANNPENLAGHHSVYQVVLVEEATGIKEALYPVIFGALSTGVIQILLMISNPTQRQGTFADSHLRPKERENYFRYHISFETARRVSRRWAQRLIDKYGRESPIVKVRVFGEFASDDPRQLIAFQWIINAQNRDITPDGSLPRFRITIDVSDGGECETIVILAMHFQSFSVGLRCRRFSHPAHLAPIMAAEEGVKIWEEFDLKPSSADIVVDSIGVGAGTAGYLLKLNYPVVAYQGGAGSSDTKQWRNCRVQSYCVARNAFRDGRVGFDDRFFEASVDDTASDWDDFIAQLTSIKTKDNADRVEDLQTKREMMDEGKPSPDLADAWAMQYATEAPQLMLNTASVGQSDQPIIIKTRGLDGMFRG